MAALSRHGGHQRPTETTSPPPDRRDLAPLARELWTRALPLRGTPAQDYLENRGIGHSTIGRYEPSALTYEAGVRVRSRALFLPITEHGEIVALARVFIDRYGNKNPLISEPKRTLADPRGGAVAIGCVTDDHLNLAEGFEEAESVIAMHGLPGCWSVNGTEQYARLQIPDHIRRITIYSQHGKAATEGVAKAEPRLTAGGRSLRIVLPPLGGDWNDAWMAQA